MADAILAGAGETVDSLQKKIAAKYKPHSLALPGTRLRLSNQVRYQLLKSANVVGYIEGSDPLLKKQAVVIGGHLDHLGSRGEYIYNGAEDNASGACGVLAMARALALNPEKPKRSVVFCLWTGEEEGLFGSRYYVEHPLFALDKTVAYLNLDMIAQPWDEKGLRRMMRMLGVKEGEELLKKIKPENFLPLSLTAAAPGLQEALRQADRYRRLRHPLPRNAAQPGPHVGRQRPCRVRHGRHALGLLHQRHERRSTTRRPTAWKNSTAPPWRR